MRNPLVAAGMGVVIVNACLNPANAATTCVTAPVSTYTASGFSCSVGSLTFSQIQVITTTSGGGSVTLTDFVPFVFGNESGLALDYTALATVAGASADVAWTYVVSGVPAIVDAYLALAGNTTGQGQIGVSEVLSNGVTLALNSAGSTLATFAAVTGDLFVMKDQATFVGIDSVGTATTSILTNAFSVSEVPLPGALPLFATGLAGLGALGWRRKRRALAA